MSKRNFLEKIAYRYEMVGHVEKNGKVYKKYRKKRRLPNLKAALRLLLFISILLVAFKITNALLSLQPKH